jgi:hypothetical protein
MEQRESDLEVRVRLLERIRRVGVVRTDPNTGEEIHLPVVVGPDDAPFLALGDRLLVAAADASRAAEVLDLGKEALRPIGGLAVIEVRLTEPDGVFAAIERLRAADPPVAAQPHHLVFGASGWGRVREADDPEVAPRLAPPDEHGVLPGTGVRVAVVDNGIARESLIDPWLHDIAPSPDDIDPKRVYEPIVAPDQPTDTLDVAAGHGTLVTGIIRQLAVGCEIDEIRALDSDGVGTEEEIARGIARAVEGRASIINLSLGGYTQDDDPPAVISAAIATVPGDVIIVAAAGNESTERPLFPGAIRRVVSVAATIQKGEDTGPTTAELEPWSNHGWWVDVAAPGTWISTFVTGRENPDIETDGSPDVFTEPYAWCRGTSFAAAAVSGALASEQSTGGGTIRDALIRLRSRPGNVRLPWGGISIDIWED